MTRVLLVALIACSSSAKPAAPLPPANDQPTPEPPADSTAAPPESPRQHSSYGKMCQLGNDREGPPPTTPLVTCGPGLSCCYPCGDKGCDYTCMTDSECETKRP